MPDSNSNTSWGPDDPQQGYFEDDEDELEDTDEQSEDSEDAHPLYVVLSHRGHRQVQLDCPKLPLPLLPMHNDLSITTNKDSSAWPRNEPCFLGCWAGLDDPVNLYLALETPTNTKPMKRACLSSREAATSPTAAAAARRNPVRAASSAIRSLMGVNGSATNNTSTTTVPGSSSSPAPAADADAAGSRSAANESPNSRRRRRSATGDDAAAEGGRLGSPVQRAAHSSQPGGYSLVTSLRSAAAAMFGEKPGSASGSSSSTAAAAAGEGSGQWDGNSTSGRPSSGYLVASTAGLVLGRELGGGAGLGLAPHQQRHMSCYRAFPQHCHQVRDEMSSRAYIGQYSSDGAYFVAAFQDKRVRLYDTSNGVRDTWRLRKDITTRMTRWTITDTTTSPDQRFLVYASISPVAYLVNVGANLDVVESQANITEVHEALNFSRAPSRNRERPEDDEDYYGNFGIWSVAWSPSGTEMIAGTNESSVYLFDFESRRNVARFQGHTDDVNAVAYLDPQDPNILVSGSDDAVIMVWDKRMGGLRTTKKAQGLLIGHTEGLTHLCARGDGRYLISNSKDQTIKLWDVRTMVSPTRASQERMLGALNSPRVPPWDYRWEGYPAAAYDVRHAHDSSVMTYRGHKVKHTLIRAYYSPAHTTGQRYIYAGSADGTVRTWDVVTGQLVHTLQAHNSLVRDCSWHPHEPELTTVSWDGTVVTWGVDSSDMQGGGWTVGAGTRKEDKRLGRIRGRDMGYW